MKVESVDRDLRQHDAASAQKSGNHKCAQARDHNKHVTLILMMIKQQKKNLENLQKS